MDRFQAMQAFTRIVELGAFGKARTAWSCRAPA